eukprot:TRINITY_DN2702_c0_g1_i3.p1 TRINITY_DN2702_c0_g1~~TRINITY_DN2702_c0_g1_i3.p1  ORF type:complete len:283 (-),score=13.04 TRINITY_DN2702_c0_g1_i3:185-985(-)
MDTIVSFLSAVHLRMADVARWRAVDISTKTLFDANGDENVWLHCARSQFKTDRLLVSGELYARSHRKLCFSLHSMLQRANYMLSPVPLFVEDVEEAILLEHRLREATYACSDHRASSGRDAQVLLGQFDLRAGDTVFRFGGEGNLPPVAGLPPGILIVRMFFDRGKLMTYAVYGVLRGGVIERLREAESLRFTLGVDSADCEVSMSCRSILLCFDGRWRASTCKIDGQLSLQGGMDWQLRCVLALLEGEPSGTRPHLVNASKLVYS